MGKDSIRVAVIPGDGTGPEVVREGLKVLDAAAAKRGFRYETATYDYGAERYLRTGEVLPDGALDEFRSFDAIYLGAVGHPEVKPGILEKGILLKIRFGLDQYINLRPVKLYPGVDCPLKGKGPKDLDYLIVRENTEGLYSGGGGFLYKGTPNEVAVQEMIDTRHGVERCIRYAYELARRRGREKKLLLCAKTNVLTYCHDLWWRVFEEVGREYADVKQEYAHVDATCMWMVKSPDWFDVIVTTNMFGDIITDLAAMTQGGLGIAAGANINPEGTSMFEPMGGSAPKYAGKDVINPLAAICAAMMMLEELGLSQAAADIDRAVAATTPKLKSLSAGKMGYTTSQVGDLVCEAMSE